MHHTFSDLPLPFHGSDQAAAPAELALHALAACLTSTLVYHCSARDIRVRSVTAEIEASLDACGFLRIDDDTAPGFKDVSVTLHADTDGDLAELQDIVDHAPMLDVFTRPIPVRATAERCLETTRPWRPGKSNPSRPPRGAPVPALGACALVRSAACQQA